MFITVALGAQHILGFLLFQPWPDRDEGHGVVSRHTTAQMLLGGRKGKEDTLIFGLSCRCGIFIRMGCWNLEGSLAFDAL